MSTATPFLLDLATRAPIIPVIVVDRVADAVPLARALVAGGLTVLEVTLRTPEAVDCIRAIADAVPDAVVGAGTLRLPEDAAIAAAAGSRFAVSPGYTPELGAACTEAGLPLLPGVSSASDLMRAYADGFRFCKFFPAAAAGGIPMLTALSGPFPDVSFCPTGGITQANAPDYLAVPSVRVCGGTWITPSALVRWGDWATITELAARAAAITPAR